MPHSIRGWLVFGLIALAAGCGSGGGSSPDASRNPDASDDPEMPPPPCDLHATTTTLDDQVAAAVAGQTVCLAAGDYGEWAGTDKAIVLRSEDARTATMTLDFRTDDAGFTLWSMTIAGGRIADGANHITIRSSTFTAQVMVDGVVNGDILFDHNIHDGFNTCDGCSPAMIHLAYNSETPSGVTITRSLFANSNLDGVQTGVGVNIIDNEFRNLTEMGPDDPAHTDPIQLLDAKGSIVRGNYIHHCADGIVAYDGVRNATIEDNVIDLVDGRWGIELYSDTGSIIRHNTLVYGEGCAFNQPCGWIVLDHKDTDPAGTGTVIVDNIATEISIANGSTAAEEHHNMVRNGAGGSDVGGVPIYEGGDAPTTRAGFALAAGSPGVGAASDGGNVGIR